jgi:hypothetical protein
LTLELSGSPGAGLRSAGGVLLDGDGDGTAGGNYSSTFPLLQGDVNNDGSVNAEDASEVKRKFFTRSGDTNTAEPYSIFHDVDGSGTILAYDFSEVKKRFFTTLPPPRPAPANPAKPQRVAGALGLFGSTRILD